MLRWKSSLKPADDSGGVNGLSDGLIRAYLAEDLTDELGNANLTVRGTSASSTTGKDNNCYTYPTTGGHITDWYPSGSAWTVSCWMNADAINSATFNGTVGCHDANNHRAYWGLGNSNEAVLAVGSTFGQDAAATYSAGTWYNFITIWDGTDAWFFINGELRIKFAATFSGTSTDPLHLGERVFNAGASYTQWDGKQDETYIWDRALDVGSATSVGDTGGGDIAALQTLFYASFNSSGITLETEATTTATSFAAPTDIDVNIPAVSIDDILLLLCTTTNESQPTDSPPSGWTKIREQDNSSASGETVAAYWKRSSVSAVATTESWSAFYPSGESYYIWVGSYSGCATSGSPIDTSDGNEVGFSSSVATSFTTNATNTMVVSMAGIFNQTATWSPSGEIIETNYNGSNWASVNGSIESTAGSKTVTATLSGSTRSSIVTVALRDTVPIGQTGDALILNGVTNNNTGGVETSMRADGSSTVYGSYAIGNMDFRDASKNGSWADDGLGCLWDQSTDESNWETLLGSTSGTFYIYEQGTSTLIFSFAWTGDATWSGTIQRYGTTSLDFTGTVPANSTRIDVYHVKD